MTRLWAALVSFSTFFQEHRVGCSYATVPIRQDINKQMRDIFTDLDTNGRGESEMGGLRDSTRYQKFSLGLLSIDMPGRIVADGLQKVMARICDLCHSNKPK